jgi:hypothetical protein
MAGITHVRFIFISRIAATEALHARTWTAGMTEVFQTPLIV